MTVEGLADPFFPVRYLLFSSKLHHFSYLRFCNTTREKRKLVAFIGIILSPAKMYNDCRKFWFHYFFNVLYYRAALYTMSCICSANRVRW